MTKWKKTLIFGGLELAMVVVAYRIVLMLVINRQIISQAFAAGPHVSGWVFSLVVTFLLLRLMVAVVLPGMILARLGLVVFDAWQQRRSGAA